MHTYL